MKRLLFIFILALLLAPIVSGDFLGLKEAPEWVSFPLLEPLDSVGVPGPPDSVHVFSYIMGSTLNLAYNARSTTYPFTAAGIDTSKINGDTTYWFIDQIQDIDGSAGANEALSIKVVLFYDELPTATHATLQKVPDTLSHLFDSLYADLDSIQAQSTWVAEEGSLIDSSAVYGAVEQLMADSQGVWIPSDTLIDGELLAFMPDDWTAADSAAYQGVTDITDADMAAMADTIYNRDTSDNVVAGSFGLVLQELYDENQRIGDSIDALEAWVAQEGSLFNPLTDSVLVDGEAFALTDGAISALTIALDAIGADELAVSGVEEIRNSVWDAILSGLTFNIPTSAGRRVRELSDANIITTGTAQRGTLLSIILAAGTSFPDSILNGNQVVIIGGTGSGQARHIENWTNATDSIGLHAGDPFTIAPDNTSEYEVRFAGATEVIHIHDSAVRDIWIFDTTGLKVSGSFAEAIAESDTVGIFTMLINNIFARLDVDTTLDLDAQGNVIISTLNDLGEIVAVMPDDWTAADSAAYQGVAGTLDSTAVYGALEQLMADSQGVWIPSDTLIDGELLAFMPDDWTAADTAGYQGAASGLTPEQIAAVIIDSIRNASPALPSTPTDTTLSGNLVGNCTGNGPNKLTIIAIDTANTDTLTGIDIFISNEAGAPEVEGRTGTDGSETFSLTLGTWRVQAAFNNTLYNFDDTAYVVSQAFDTVAILGYLQFIPNPSNPDLSNVFAHLRSILGEPVDSVVVYLQLVTQKNVASTSSGFTIGDNIAVDTSDDAGFFLFPAVRSFIYDDSLRSFYRITGKLRKQTKFVLDSLRIPDTGNLDITDEIGALFP